MCVENNSNRPKLHGRGTIKSNCRMYFSTNLAIKGLDVAKIRVVDDTFHTPEQPLFEDELDVVLPYKMIAEHCSVSYPVFSKPSS